MTTSPETTSYRVLARTKRPQRFSEMVGQPMLVTTLQNALAQGRLPHAFLLTGTRGVGKTTTARLLAKVLNCSSGTVPLVEPCGTCPSCVAITNDQHMDVIEMDAATHTGVEDIREIIESIAYKPVLGRFKLYIIDEVHMLSRNAFNALLKTLEEPPPHVKFIFATTESRKIPATILSRCLRLELRRVAPSALAEYFQKLAHDEGVNADHDALTLIAEAADGSVRDGLSILEQALINTRGHDETIDDRHMTLTHVQQMLGMADRHLIQSLLYIVLKGAINEALDHGRSLLLQGGDPEQIVSSLLQLTHQCLVAKIQPSASTLITIGNDLNALVPSLSVGTLTQTWQIALKGLDDMKSASMPHVHLDMVLIRMAYVQHLWNEETVHTSEQTTQSVPKSVTSPPSTTTPVDRPLTTPPLSTNPDDPLSAFRKIVQLFDTRREPLIADYLRHNVGIIDMTPGTITLSVLTPSNDTVHNRIQKLLFDFTGERWRIVVVKDSQAESLATIEKRLAEQMQAQLLERPDVQKLAALFPNAQITINT